MAMFREKPVIIEAFRLGIDFMPDWFCDARSAGSVRTYAKNPDNQNPFESEISHAEILTLKGLYRADFGDYIIKGVKGELYPCEPDIFELIYESVGV